MRQTSRCIISRAPCSLSWKARYKQHLVSGGPLAEGELMKRRLIRQRQGNDRQVIYGQPLKQPATGHQRVILRDCFMTEQCAALVLAKLSLNRKSTHESCC